MNIIHMAPLLPIVKGKDNPILRAISKPVKKIDKPLLRLIDRMYPTMEHANGVGLAAPQVGENIRLFVMNMYEVDEATKKRTITAVNPRITDRSDEIIEDVAEGCLSVPGVFGKVPRHRSVTFSYQDANGRTHSLVMQNLNARIVQHEIDHLDGILCVDKMTEITESPELKKAAKKKTV